MTREEIYENFENQIKKVLENCINMKFSILINNKPILENNSNTTKFAGRHRVCLALAPETSGGGLLIGSANELKELLNIRVDKKRPVVISKGSSYNKIMEMLADTRIYGTDTTIDNNDLIIELNLDFKLINIKQRIFNDLFEKIYVNDDRRELVLSNGNKLSGDVIAKLYNDFDYNAMINYRSTVNLFVEQRMKYYKGEIQFYTCLGAWVPIFISGNNGFFNPLLNAKRNKEIIENTSIYKRARLHQVNYKNLNFMFIINDDFSRSLNLPKTFLGSFYFNFSIICGLLNNKMPNTEYSYYSDGVNTISIEDYNNLSPSNRSLYQYYKLVNSLYELCLKYRSSGYKTESLFNIAKNAELLEV